VKQIIPVIFATDDNYVPYCGVAITSLIENSNKEINYQIYILYDTLSKINIQRLISLSSCNVTISCVSISEYVKNINVTERNHITVASTYRLLIPKIFPHLKKVVYLDSDLIINADIFELYNIDIDKYPIAAVCCADVCDVSEWMNNYITKTLGVEKSNFFNAGVLIINIKKFNAGDIGNKCFDILNSRSDLYFMDQCALNIVCEGNVLYLNEKWNYETQWHEQDTDNHYIETDNNNLPYIIHYSGYDKPWIYPENYLSNLFWRYARKTSFYESILYLSTENRLKKVIEAQLNDAMETIDIIEVLSTGKKNRGIAIYGAGNVGRNLATKINRLKAFELVAWVDADHKNKVATPMQVEPIKRLYEVEFDYVIIAIQNLNICAEVKNTLVKNKIAPEKIVFVNS